jgi:hypothetical protein
MTYSVASSLFKNYSPFVDTQDNLSVSYGKVLINYASKEVAVVDLYGTVLVTGNSKRYLKELQGYQDTLTTTGILKFVSLGNEIVLTSAQLQLSIWDLAGTVKPVSTLNTYLGFQAGELTGVPEYKFKVSELADVSINNATAQQHGWVLTSNNYNSFLYRPSTSIPKDPSYTVIHAYWSLQPESSSIRRFDDAGSQPERDTHIFRIPKPNENASHLYINYNLTIAFDVAPKLSNHLNAAGNSIFNQQYVTEQESLSTSVVTLSIDMQSRHVTVFDGATTTLINLDINVPVTDAPSMYNHSLIVTNFKGELNLPSNVYVENGTAPVFIGGDVLLSIIATNYPVTKICILQKTLQAL